MKTITLRQVPHNWPLYMLILPAILGIAVFSYTPAVSGVYHAFYKWNGDDVSEFVGLKNFRGALQDEALGKAFGVVMIFIAAFGVVMIFIAANLVKMIPSIVTAVVIHRLISNRARYLYRVAFVIPMVIPAMVWLLIWKFFYDPNVGVLNAVLEKTGGIGALQWLDEAMPVLAARLTPFRETCIDSVFGSVWGLGLAGVFVLTFLGGFRRLLRGWILLLLLLPGAFFLFGLAGPRIPILEDLIRCLPLGGAMIYVLAVARAGIVIAALAGLTELLRRRGFSGPDHVRRLGGGG